VLPIAIDVMSGDSEPREYVAGALQALADDAQLRVLLVGEPQLLNAALASVAPAIRERAEVVAASPCQHARSTAIAFCGADLRPLRWVSTPTHGVHTFASSAPVTTAITPGAPLAASASICLMRACACGERT
jgi:hypothetical protein